MKMPKEPGQNSPVSPTISVSDDYFIPGPPSKSLSDPIKVARQNLINWNLTKLQEHLIQLESLLNDNS